MLAAALCVATTLGALAWNAAPSNQGHTIQGRAIPGQTIQGQTIDHGRAAQSDAAGERRREHLAFTGAYLKYHTREIRSAPGESFVALLERAGASGPDARQALTAILRVHQLQNLPPGQEVSLVFERRDREASALRGISFRPELGLAVSVNRTAANEFRARVISRQLTFEIARINAPVGESISSTALQLGATDLEVDALGAVCGYELDLQRDIRPQDRFEMVFERIFDDAGLTVSTGALMFVALDTRSGPRRFYAFKAPGEERAQWYDSLGRSARRLLMKTPVNGARLSSGFGDRKHPILGFTQMHPGVDFAAPEGSPVLAAGEGVIVAAGHLGAYGNYLRIRHAGGYATAYAHLSRFAGAARRGAPVRQGQVIGYVGATGRATGPHLHFEVLVGGVHANPMSLNAAAGRTLTRRELALFRAEVARIDALRADLWRGGTRTRVENSLAHSLSAHDFSKGGGG